MLPKLHILSDNFNVIRYAIDGGARLIQYRNKNFSYKKHFSELKKIIHLCREKNVICLINDYVELAMEVGADGIHIGMEDTPLDVVKKVFPRDKIVGFTVHNLEELALAHKYEDVINYIGVGSLFPSKTKKVKLLSLEKFEQICKISKFPVIGIGGITTDKICKVLRSGAYGVAVASAVSESENPTNTVVNMLNIIKGCL